MSELKLPTYGGKVFVGRWLQPRHGPVQEQGPQQTLRVNRLQLASLVLNKGTSCLVRGVPMGRLDWPFWVAAMSSSLG